MSNKSEIKTDFLTERINQNEKNQTVDINKWAFGFLDSTDKQMNILELCCGTGRQTAFLLKKFPNASVSCLDASGEAISKVKEVFINETGRMKFFNTGIDDFFATNAEKFDIVFCSYGLYYSKDISFVLSRIDESLTADGRFLVMGPYGDNNKQIFDILLKLGVSISAEVTSSSSTFMYEKVLAYAVKKFETIHIHTTRNKIFWNDPESVVNYWKNSTFFEPSAEDNFYKLVNEQVTEKGNFMNEKRIMFLEAVKNN